MDDLDNFLDQGTTEPAIEAPQPETIGQPRDESGRFAPKETGVEPQATAEPVSPTPDKLPQEEYKATKAERERRQAAEARAAALEAELQSLRQPKEPPAPPPSIWEDDQAALTHVRDDAVASQARPTVSNPFPETDCNDCGGREGAEPCAVCGSDLHVPGYDCFVCQLTDELPRHALADADDVLRAIKTAMEARLLSLSAKAA